MADFQKQTVQWFPGHMARTRRLIRENLSLVDAVTELLDARCPLSSRNPELAEMIGDKPHIVLLNKCDLADPEKTAAFQKYFDARGEHSLAVDCRSGKGLHAYPALVRTVLKDRIEANRARGMAGRALRIMVVGIPNTGKSSFINRMAGKSRAKVADRPGVTRQNQWFAIGSGIELLDTPGVLWPKFEDERVGNTLAFIGSVKDEVLDSETLAFRLIEFLKRYYPAALEQRYQLDHAAETAPLELFDRIGQRRGMLLRGGEIDYERVSNMLLDEFRGGLLGRITVDFIPGERA
ncbi:MAG TPA: ribosome biogenesis GTPase YlqF [Candidatus Onthovicinus excrementipullorum]|nr:ribosome biogenesis GTPase YlqF [Candidatus Onthovicinus excrementipullorum]